MANGSFIAISGLRKAGKTTVYQKLKSVLPNRFPEYAFSFLGSPLGELPHPLQWSEEERSKQATARLFNCWARLEDFTVKKILPSLKRGEIVVVDGFGLDAVLYAIAHAPSDQVKDVFNLHKQLVEVRLKLQGISPPTYLLASACEETLSARLECANNVIPLRELKSAEETAISAYFAEGYGQWPELRMDAEALDAALQALGGILGRREAHQVARN